MRRYHIILIPLALIWMSCEKIAEHLDVKDDAMLNLVDATAPLEKLATGFRFTEGPVWWAEESAWLFSDIPANIVYRIGENETTANEYIKPSGNSNGLNFDSNGRLLLCRHSGRDLALMEGPDQLRSLVSAYQGKRLNSPNDLVLFQDGLIIFTDPPYGLQGQDDSPDKELPFNGVYLWNGDSLRLLDSTYRRPNGVALSPDEKTLYLAQSQIEPGIFRFKVLEDRSIQLMDTLLDATTIDQPGTPDGMKVDEDGNLYATGPGGVLIFSPAGKHLGTITIPEVPTNLAFGGADGKTLFITAQTSVYSQKMLKKGLD